MTSARRARARLAAARAAKREGAAPSRTGPSSARRAAARTPSSVPPWSVFSPPGAEPGGAGLARLHRGADPLQRAHPGVPGVGDPDRVGRHEAQGRAARERLPQPQPRAQAVGLGGRGDLADELLAPRLGRQGDRPGGQHVPAPGGDGEREARQEDADDHEHMFACNVAEGER